MVPLEDDSKRSFFRGHMPGVKKLLKRGARIGLFLADPPTTTLQRIKAITTGKIFQFPRLSGMVSSTSPSLFASVSFITFFWLLYLSYLYHSALTFLFVLQVASFIIFFEKLCLHLLSSYQTSSTSMYLPYRYCFYDDWSSFFFVKERFWSLLSFVYVFFFSPRTAYSLKLFSIASKMKIVRIFEIYAIFLIVGGTSRNITNIHWCWWQLCSKRSHQWG